MSKSPMHIKPGELALRKSSVGKLETCNYPEYIVRMRRTLAGLVSLCNHTCIVAGEKHEDKPLWVSVRVSTSGISARPRNLLLPITCDGLSASFLSCFAPLVPPRSHTSTISSPAAVTSLHKLISAQTHCSQILLMEDVTSLPMNSFDDR